MRALAMELGGSHATCAKIEDREIVASHFLAVDSGTSLRPLLPFLAETLRALRNERRSDELTAVVLGFCGLVDYLRGRILSTNGKFDDGPSLDLVAWCREELDLPLKMENDARLALLGERYAGAAQGFDDIVMVTLGTGIGGAAMCQGRLLRGKHAQAGCLGGHIPVDFEGRVCTCGAVGCAEAEASSVSLPQVCESHPEFASSSLATQVPISYEKLFFQAAQGDRLAHEIVDRSLLVWSSMIVGLVHAYDPEIVVVGGGVMKSADRILPALQAHVAQRAWTPWGKVRVVSAELGRNAALLGAIPLLEGVADL
ncbi:MAG TPA: ROK family protein [Candidatus Limnocylindrales bacterium]|nr:ROK family protein [Candidatus Limnocylindrales bacterium]